MILPEVDVLSYALRTDAPGYDLYSQWLTRLVDGAGELALHDLALAGVVRVVANPRALGGSCTDEPMDGNLW